MTGARAADLMRTYSRSASPRSYEVWFTFAAGTNPALNQAVKDAVAAQDILSAERMEELFELFCRPADAPGTDGNSAKLLHEVDQVIALIAAANGATAEYGQSLRRIGQDLGTGIDRARLAGTVEALLLTTRQIVASNRTLQDQLCASRQEIDQLRQALDIVRTESLTDVLTGIPNRKGFDARLKSAFAQAAGGGTSLAVIVIDVDDFKLFNDKHGHLTGDQVLRLVAGAMRDSLDQPSLLARFGGEEFAAVLPDTSPSDAFACAERIRTNVLRRNLVRRSTGVSLGRVTVSLGVAMMQAGDTELTLLARADQCVYRAKQLGRNRTSRDWDPPAEREGSVAA